MVSSLGQSISRISFSHSQHPVVRRADWRFLLDNPTPQRSIVFEGGLLADAVSMISASTIVSGSNHSGDDHDLAVAVNPTEKILATINSSLKPGGFCYLEWQVNNFFHTSTIKNQLTSSGFDYIKLYLPMPTPDKIYTDIWIPIDSKGAVEFAIVENLRAGTNNHIKHLAKIMRYLVWKIWPNLLIAYPYLLSSKRKYTIASIASKCIPTPRQTTRQHIHNNMIGNKINDGNLYQIIDTTIKNEWQYLGLKSKPDKISALMLCNEGSKDQIILYIFADEIRIPSLIVKIARTKDSIPVVSSEATNLESIQARFPNLEGIPRVLFCIDDGRLFAQARPYVNGVPFSGVVKERNRLELCLRVTSWLIRLARNTATDVPPDWRESLIDPVLSTLTPLFSSKLSRDQLQKTCQKVSSLNLSYLVCEHRDLSPWNIIIDHEGKIGVIDWEVARLNGLPAADLILFLTYVNYHFDKTWGKQNFSESYRNMLDISTPAGRIFNECMELYSSKLNISKSEIDSIRLLTWLGQLYRRIDRDYKSAPEIKLPLNEDENITLALWEVELETQKTLNCTQR